MPGPNPRLLELVSMNVLIWKSRCRILTEPQSLKEKRSVVKSVLARVRNKFPFSAAEVGQHDMLNVMEIGLVGVSAESNDLERQVERCRKALERDFPVEFYDEDLSIEAY